MSPGNAVLALPAPQTPDKPAPPEAASWLAPLQVPAGPASKLCGENYAMLFTKTMGLETVSLRYFNVFGPRQDPGSQYAAVIPLFITSLLESRRPVIFGDGHQSRDFTYVDNVVDANLAAARGPDGSGHAVNIACGERDHVTEPAMHGEQRARLIHPRREHPQVEQSQQSL